MRRSVRAVRRRVRAGYRRLTGTVIEVDTDRPLVALTFDDGPDPETTPEVLEVLDRYGARGTFFVVGESARRHRGLVQRLTAAGHEVGNHTWDHPELPSLPVRAQWRQIRACGQATDPLGEPLFRPPYLLQSRASYLAARSLGYRVIGCTVQVEDWQDREAGWMARRLLEGIAPGKIVLLHDAICRPSPGASVDRAPLCEALDTVLARLRGRFDFVTVGELLEAGRPVLRPWFFPTHDDWPDRSEK